MHKKEAGMKQVYHNLCTYSADLFGVNSALYELGGLLVMHDASGCNSTYNTHDEPRWYTMESMVYVSGLNEKDAILGNDQRLIDDVCAVAEKEHPKFIGLTRSVLPTYMGTDLKGIARVIEKRTGIPTFGFPTNGMDSYVLGAGAAFRAIAERFLPKAQPENHLQDTDGAGRSDASACAADRIRLNLMGVTPLDFSVCGNVEALTETMEHAGFEILSNWAMGSTLEDLQQAPAADVSLVVSVTGLPAAEYLYETYGVPYVLGIPVGREVTKQLEILIRRAFDTGRNQSLFALRRTPLPQRDFRECGRKIRIIGEAFHCASLRCYLEWTYGCRDVSILCPLERDGGVLRETDARLSDEASVADWISEAEVVIADPVYQRVTGPDIRFLKDPHDAYSGRMYHRIGRRFVGADADPFPEFHHELQE
jgi:nitrogenase molybdenum-iron protein alpha/beta subunit